MDISYQVAEVLYSEYQLVVLLTHILLQCLNFLYFIQQKLYCFLSRVFPTYYSHYLIVFFHRFTSHIIHIISLFAIGMGTGTENSGPVQVQRIRSRFGPEPGPD